MNLSSFAILAQAAEPAADAADLVNAGGGTSGWLLLVIVVAVFVLPIALGYALAKTLKMPEIAGRVGGILFAAVIGLTPFVYNIAVGTSEGLTVGEAFRGCLRLGIDLAGGTNLVYEVDRDATEKVIDDRVMDRMVGAVAKRINPSGTEEVTVRKVGRDRLEVIVPGADPEKVAQIKDGIVNTGTLEFAILANEVDHANLINQARTLPGTERKLRSGPTVIAEWKSVAFDEAGQAKMTSTGGRVAFRGVDEAGNLVTDADAAEAGPIDLQFLIVYEAAEARVTGKFLRNSAPTADEAGRPAVGFTFDTRGSILFGNLTTKYRPKSDGFESRLAVLLNDKIESAPALNSAITGGNGIITGRFTQAEVRELVDVLNAGALEVPLKKTPVSEFTISPLLGEDTVRKAVTSILAGGLLVLVFMGVYYLVAGAVADLCLVLNIVLVMGAMVFIDATFTLPGLAGIVLTIGMAVDANVLIFERIREESSRGASLKAAIANGFEKAFSTIVDANVTTLITAVILYAIGTDQVRGFAVTLFIGIVMSMFTALVFGRLVFDVLAQKRFIKSLKMTGIVGQTSIGFMGKVPLAAVFSVALIAVGLGAFFTRGVKMLDIDFRGGTMVTFELTESAETADVRDVLEGAPAFGGDVSVERLELADATNAVSGKLFRMRTSLKDGDGEASTDAVEKAIVDAFETSGLVLRKVSFDFTTTADAETPTAEVALGGNDEIKPDTLGRYIG
ncbi:MAG: protein translocase subunit SecD, partial [Planctomycetota bacterium]